VVHEHFVGEDKPMTACEVIEWMKTFMPVHHAMRFHGQFINSSVLDLVTQDDLVRLGFPVGLQHLLLSKIKERHYICVEFQFVYYDSDNFGDQTKDWDAKLEEMQKITKDVPYTICVWVPQKTKATDLNSLLSEHTKISLDRIRMTEDQEPPHLDQFSDPYSNMSKKTVKELSLRRQTGPLTIHWWINWL
jgi:hypothetical protein